MLLGIAIAVWLVVAIVRTPDKPQPKTPRRTWEQIKDSMRHADSVRYAEWAAEREQRYDSFRVADSLRRAEWKQIRQAQYDSFRIADSLWRDSVGWRCRRSAEQLLTQIVWMSAGSAVKCAKRVSRCSLERASSSNWVGL